MSANRKRMQFGTTVDAKLLERFKTIAKATGISISKLTDSAIELLLEHYDKEVIPNQYNFSSKAYKLLISNIIDIIEKQKRDNPNMSKIESYSDLLNVINSNKWIDPNYPSNKIKRDYALLATNLPYMISNITSEYPDITKDKMYENLLNRLRNELNSAYDNKSIYNKIESEYNDFSVHEDVPSYKNDNYIQLLNELNNKKGQSFESSNQMELLSDEELNDIQQSLNVIRKYRNKVIHEANSINSSKSKKNKS